MCVCVLGGGGGGGGGGRGRNELEICTTLAHIYISFHFIPYYASAIHKHMHTHILKPFEGSKERRTSAAACCTCMSLSPRVKIRRRNLYCS